MPGPHRIASFALALLAAAAPPARSAGGPDAEGFEEELALARRHYVEGRLFRAENLLEEVMEEGGPEQRRLAATLLVRVRMARTDWDGAEEAASFLESVDAPSLEEAEALADLDFARGRLEKAERRARALAADHPSRLRAAVPLARLLDYTGRREEASAFVRERLFGRDLAALPPEDKLAAARLLRAARDWESAAALLVRAERELIDAGRPTAEVLLELGDLYRLAKSLDGETPRAFATYRECLEQNPSLVDAKVGRAEMHLYVNDSADAEKEIDEALAIAPAHVGALTLRAWFRVLDGRHSDAIELLDRALAIRPTDKRAWAVRAAACLLLRREEEHERALQRALEIDPLYGEAHRTVADALSRHYRFEEAVAWDRRAVETDPDDGESWIALGRDLCFLGREKEGREALERSYEVFPYPHPWRHNMELVLDKLEREFREVRDPPFVVRLHADEAPVLAAPLKEALASDLEELSKRYGYRPDERVLVEMLASHADFSVRTVGFAGLGAVGACFGDFVTLLSPRSELRRGFCWRRTVRHELTHVVTLGRSKHRVPRWLTEGLSVYEEQRGKPLWRRDQELELIAAYRNGELIPVEEFNAAFRTARIGFAYYQGGLLCEFIAERFGFERILELLDAYARDLETPDAVREVLGVEPDQLDSAFEEWVGERFVKGVRVQVPISERRRALLRRKLRKHPEDPDLLAELAWATYRKGLEVDADEYLGRALEADPDHPVALRLAALRSLERRREDLALEQLERAFAAGGAEYFAALQLARLRAGRGEWDEAERALRLAVECFPAGVGAGNPYVELYRLLSSRSREEEAAAWLDRYLDRAETEVDLRLEAARRHAERKEWERAIARYREVLDVDPFVRQVYVELASAQRNAGRPWAAVESLRRALAVAPRLEPGYTPAPEVGDGGSDERRARARILVEIADIEAEAGDREAALEDLRRAQEEWSEVPLTERLRGLTSARPQHGRGS